MSNYDPTTSVVMWAMMMNLAMIPFILPVFAMSYGDK